MIRYGLGAFVAAAACGAFGVAGCGSGISDTVAPLGTGGGGGASSAGGATGSGGAIIPTDGGVRPLLKCEGACCPSSAACYSDPSKGVDSPGSECQATHDNTGQSHIQMRQAWIRATTPPGNTNSVVYGVLSGRTQLDAPDCYQGLDNATKGSGGYVQLIDFFLGGSDTSKHYSTVGYAAFIPPTAAALTSTLTDGFTYGAETGYLGDPSYTGYGLTTAQVTNPTDATTYPHGLPLPMGLKDGWKVGSTKAIRIPADFNVATDRVALLGKLASDGEYGSQGFNGVFFYDNKTGFAHGYGSMGWTVVYAKDGKSHLAIPIREVETKSVFNDPTHPNCVGAFRANATNMTVATGCKSIDPTNPAWGCYTDGTTGDLTDSTPSPVACAPGAGPAETNGFFLITELEQLYSADLQSTLCVSYPGKFDSMGNPDLGTGFYQGAPTSACAAGACCRGPSWDPTKPDYSGIPKGDWCAATNSAATATCHDAWHSHSFHVFVGGKINGVPDDPTQPLPTKPF